MAVKKKYLLLLAGLVWCGAGSSILKIGIEHYLLGYFNYLNLFASAIIFIIFYSLIFRKMVLKHYQRIRAYNCEYQPVYKFFDLKSYLIMIFMMSLGIGLRASSVVPKNFIAFFYSGLGFGLFLAGLLFLKCFWELNGFERKGEIIVKKYFNIAFVYAILAMICGVFYREFTKFQHFDGKTVLAVSHVHFFVLGTVLFLIIGCLSLLINIEEQKSFKKFLYIYNIGLPLMVIMFVVRGIVQVLKLDLSSGLDHMISGIAGLSHIFVGISLILFFMALRNSQKIKNN